MATKPTKKTTPKLVKSSTKNLVPIKQRPKEEIAALGKKGGIASGVSKRKNRTLKEIVKTILNTKIDEYRLVDLRAKFPEMGDEINTIADGMVMAIVDKALNGDVSSFNTLRDTSGEKPTDKHDVTSSDGSLGGRRDYTEDEIKDELKRRGIGHLLK